MEDSGKEYLDELMQRNLIHVAMWESNGEPRSFIIHDLLLSLATSEAKEGMFLNISAPDKALNCYRRVAIHDKRSDEENMAEDGSHGSSSSMSCSNRLRSLLCFTAMSQSSLYGNFKLLNVLDLELAPGIKELPKEIGKLILLKYLRVCGEDVRILPCWVGNLSNLQTLDLTDVDDIESIPTEILKLRKLRHLMCQPETRLAPGFYDSIGRKDAFGICRRPHHNRSIGDLSHLQTLYLGLDKWLVDGLGMLTGLRVLAMNASEESEELSQKLSLALLKLVRLEILWLRIKSEISLPSFSQHVYLYHLEIDGRMQKLPDHNDFPPNLTSLNLYKTHLKEDMMVVLERLPRLKELTLVNAYDGVEMKCSARGFPELESLDLSIFYSLEYWEVEKGAMPNLRKLELFLVGELKCIPDVLRHITSLQELTLGHMPKSSLRGLKKVGTIGKRSNIYLPSNEVQFEDVTTSKKGLIYETTTHEDESIRSWK